MTLASPQVAVEIVRARVGLKDGSADARIINQIPTALKEFGRRYAADPFTRPLVTTNKATTTLTIGTNGAVNLVTGYDTYQFLLEYLDKGQMYVLLSITAAPYLVTTGGFASGTWTFTRNPVHNETIVVNGVTFTFKQPGFTVSGSGEPAMNGSFIYAGEFGGKPLYTSDPFEYYCRWDTDSWYFRTDDFSPLYLDNESIDYPWEGTKWQVSAFGALPVPVVTQSVLTSVQVEIGLTAELTAINFADTLNASANASINVASYDAVDDAVTGIYDTTGSGGNAFTMANSSGLAVIRSGATFTGGGDNTYGLSITTNTGSFANLSRVRFTTTGSLPTGLSLATDYYIISYSVNTGTGLATFGVSTTATGFGPVTITSAGAGALTMTQMDSTGDPIQPLRSPQQMSLAQYLDSVFQFYSVQGNTLFLLPTDGVHPTGSLAFAVPSFPATLSALPESAEAEDLFIQILTAQSFPAGVKNAR